MHRLTELHGAPGARAAILLSAAATALWLAHATTVSAQPRITLGSAQLMAAGPDGGMIYDLAYDRDTGAGPYALTEVGVFVFSDRDRGWRHVPIPPKGGAENPPLPMRVGWGYLASEPTLNSPKDVELVVQDGVFVIRDERGGHHIGSTDRPWTTITPPTTTAHGETPFAGADLIQTQLDVTDGTPHLTVVRMDLPDDGPTTRVWRWSGQSWTSSDEQGRRTRTSTATSGVAPSWRTPGLTRRLPGDLRAQASSFIVERPSHDPTEIPWLRVLRQHSLGPECRGAVGMLASPRHGEDTPAYVALGPANICVALDGFEFNERPQWRDALAPMRSERITAAVAFPWNKAEVGFRLLVATDAGFDKFAPRSRAASGKLLLSDDGGLRWQDVTPDLDAMGGIIDLESQSLEDGSQEVWLLTERRGAYRSLQAGVGFRQAHQGIRAVPIHQLSADPAVPGQVWAASPLGLFLFSSQWSRADAMPMRSVSSVPATAEHFGQLWAGSYHGSVLVAEDATRAEREELPPRPAEVAPIIVARGQLTRPLRDSPRLRQVALVVPTGIVDGVGRGYAVVQNEGVATREGPGSWRWLPLSPLRKGSASLTRLSIVDAVAAPVGGGLILAVLGQHEDNTTIGQIWLHLLDGSGWTTLDLPQGGQPAALGVASGEVWLVTLTGRFHKVEIETEPTIGEAIPLNAACVRLATRHDPPGLGCAIAEGTPRAGPVNQGVPRPLVRLLVLSSDQLNDPELDEVSATRYRAINTLGRNFDKPSDLVFIDNDAGVFPWVTTGVAAWAPRPGVINLLPPETETSSLTDRLPSVTTFVVAGGALAVAFGLALFRLWQWFRRRSS